MKLWQKKLGILIVINILVFMIICFVISFSSEGGTGLLEAINGYTHSFIMGILLIPSYFFIFIKNWQRNEDITIVTKWRSREIIFRNFVQNIIKEVFLYSQGGVIVFLLCFITFLPQVFQNPFGLGTSLIMEYQMKEIIFFRMIIQYMLGVWLSFLISVMIIILVKLWIKKWIYSWFIYFIILLVESNYPQYSLFIERYRYQYHWLINNEGWYQLLIGCFVFSILYFMGKWKYKRWDYLENQ